MLPFSKKNNQASSEIYKDLGFGTQVNNSPRYLNPDGSFNVQRKGLPFFQSFNIYHKLITMSWQKFYPLVFLAYIAANIFFAGLYVLAGPRQFDGATGTSLSHRIYDAFFFSTQTFTTVGYGHISPMGLMPNIISAIESMVGLLSFALATGLLYGRFSKPVAKIIYSRHAVIAPYKGITAFEFKLSNKRKHELIEVEMELIFVCKTTENGRLTGRFESLSLERKKISFMPLTWTIVHPIDEKSPLYGITEKDLEDSDAEFLTILKAFDDTFSQHVYSRSSYKYSEIVWGAKFINNFNKVVDGITIVELDRIHELENAPLPVLETVNE